MSIVEPLKALDYCEKEVRKKDFASYLHGLYWPYEIRPFFYAAHAFRLELVQNREGVNHSSLLGSKEQWWLENLEQIWKGNPAIEPISVSINELRKYHVIRKSHFERMVKGHFDDSPIKTWRAFDRFIDNNFTMSCYVSIELLHMFKEPEFMAATFAGRAWGIMELLLRTKYYSDHGRFYFPEELLEKYNISPGVAVEDTDKHQNIIPEQFFDVVLEVAAYGKNNLEKAREMAGEVPKNSYLAFLNLQVAEEFYLKLEKKNFNIFDWQSRKMFWPSLMLKMAKCARKKVF